MYDIIECNAKSRKYLDIPYCFIGSCFNTTQDFAYDMSVKNSRNTYLIVDEDNMIYGMYQNGKWTEVVD